MDVVQEKKDYSPASTRIWISQTGWNPTFPRIGRDMLPAWTTSAGVPRRTASSHRARISAR